MNALKYVNSEINTWKRVVICSYFGEVQQYKVFKVKAFYLYDYYGMKICMRDEHGATVIFDAVTGYTISVSTSYLVAIKKAENNLKKGSHEKIRDICKKMAPWYGISFLGRGLYSPLYNTLFDEKNRRKYNNRIGKAVVGG